MPEKLSIYDLFAILVPGTLFIWWFCILFPASHEMLFALDKSIPEAFQTIILITACFFVGNVLQAFSSLTEPILHKTFGNKPEQIALSDGLGERYLPKDACMRIKSKLANMIGDDQGNRSLYLYALSMSRTKSLSEVFNALYGYHRAVLSLVLVELGLTLFAWLRNSNGWSPSAFGITIAAQILLVLLLWFRTKQRAFYLTREVLMAAEQNIDAKKG